MQKGRAKAQQPVPNPRRGGGGNRRVSVSKHSGVKRADFRALALAYRQRDRGGGEEGELGGKGWRRIQAHRAGGRLVQAGVSIQDIVAASSSDFL